jgi:hypothetical protein
VALDLAKMHGWIVAELARRRPIAESMGMLIDQCESARPHADWLKLRALPYADLSPLADWLVRPFREEPSIVPLKGLWFGLFNQYNENDVPVADIYVCGSERFEPSLDDRDWACGPDWWPEARYARSNVLADIYRIAYCQYAPTAEQQGGLGNDAEYPLCLGYATFTVRELMSQVDPQLLLGQSSSLGVAVGFDSGDFVLLGRLVRDGLAPI